jgi:pimeloyl-ACP methyl ester carboxylesterase
MKTTNNEELSINIKSSIQNKTLKLDQNEIRYHISGKSDAPTLVFLHPAFSDHRAFDSQIDYFSENFQVITIDLIGHGLSKALKSKDKIDSSSEHISKIFELEGIKKAHLIGVSMGSLVAQYFAYHHPQKVMSLTALGGYNIHKENKEVEKAQRSSNIGLIIRALFSIKSFRKKTALITCSTKKGQALFYESSSLYQRKSFLVMQGFQNIIKNREHIEINYPTLILVGEFDIPLAQKMAQQWHTELNNSTYGLIKNAGHCANMDQPSEFNLMVSDFISINN